MLSLGASLQGIAGVIVDGPTRDVDEARAHDFAVFARDHTARTARGRIVETGTNVPITVGDIPVSPGDFVVADGSAVVFVPAQDIERVLDAAEAIAAREAAMADSLRAGTPITAGDGEDLRNDAEEMTDDTRGQRASKLDTTAISDALDRLGIAGQCLNIKPLDHRFRMTGRAFTILYGPPARPRARSATTSTTSRPGSVVVLDNGGRENATVWGDILTSIAHRRGIAGTVIDGACRDTHLSLELGYPMAPERLGQEPLDPRSALARRDPVRDRDRSAAVRRRLTGADDRASSKMIRWRSRHARRTGPWNSKMKISLIAC